MRRGMFLGLCGLLAAGGLRAAPDEAVLMGAYLQTRLMQQVGAQADAWMNELDEAAGDEVAAASDAWCNAFGAGVRRRLEAQFGGEADARKALTAFVDGYVRAEKKGDAAYLKDLSRRLGLDPAPADYPDLGQAALQRVLGAELNRASAFLGNLQAWVDKKKSGGPDLPDLETWLDAVDPKGGSAKSGPKKAAPANPLAGAEAGLGGFEGGDDETANPLEDFRDQRTAKRKKALDQARDGMSMVARERQTAEQEAASAKIAAAQAEAEAMQRHAQKLAAVEKDALAQRQNSWSAKLKNIVSSTIGTATGVFMGSVGQRAGEAVTHAVFD
ncbi:MAG: hypothetical protein R6X19_11825 [Kiritimatiellia bacterium]